MLLIRPEFSYLENVVAEGPLVAVTVRLSSPHRHLYFKSWITLDHIWLWVGSRVADHVYFVLGLTSRDVSSEIDF